MRTIEFIVPPDAAGMAFGDVMRKFLGMSRSGTIHAKYMEDGIMLDGVRTRTNVAVLPGQVLCVALGDTADDVESCSVKPEDGPIDIVYEDEDIVVVDKQAGIATYPCGHGASHTLGNYLMGYYRRIGEVVNLHPVHRLDRTTSGLMVFVKNAHAQHVLQHRMHTDGFIREYVAFCEGIFPEKSGVIEASIAKISNMPARWGVVDGPEAKPALTRYEVVGVYGRISEVKLRLETGRTHQIRVHCAHIGCPLVGDAIYGNRSDSIDRPALHSAHLELVHPLHDKLLT
ncbi:MAG: RluA family pseudouridine synthase, partial [Eggerthellaceae bacterium]|nr:RluA family pseudouridine synthase [Eggerthellaceae bacterium]